MFILDFMELKEYFDNQVNKKYIAMSVLNLN